MILPLDKIKTAVVWLDAVNPYSFEAVEDIRKFFAERRIDARIYLVNDVSSKKSAVPEGALLVRKCNINIFGRFRRTKRCPVKKAGEELVVNLISRHIKAVESEVRRSRATFKTGRIQDRRINYDFVQTDVPGKDESRPMAVWKAVSHMLDIIK